uniref:DM domain-containing protein n=1 Tax=Ascaris lumbricoides TaxID=6252 RepID=A0A0M3HFK3_ASCLU
MPKEQYMCQLCANHGVFNQPKKGHKQKCPHRHCPCSLCALNTKRRALDQIERQLKNGTSNLPMVPTAVTNKIDVTDFASLTTTISASRIPEANHMEYGKLLNSI